MGLIGLMICEDAIARSPFVPRDPAPISVALTDDYLFYAFDWKNYNLRNDIERPHLLIRYDLAADRLEYLNDDIFPETVRCLGQNEEWVFAAGNGLAVYDRKTGIWERWSSFDDREIDAIDVGKKTVWLGTRQGVLAVDPQTEEVRWSISAADGLNADRVWCLRRIEEFLLVGTYTAGSERYRDDMFGMGLNRVDLHTREVTDVELPSWGKSDWEREMGSLAVEIYAPAEGAIRLVLWKPWKVKLFDYDPVNGEVKESGAYYFQLDSILRRRGADLQSDLAGHLLRFFLRMDLERWWAVPAVSEVILIRLVLSRFPRQMIAIFYSTYCTFTISKHAYTP